MSYGTSSPSCEYDGETRYIRITDINDNGELNEDFVSPISYEEKHVLQDGDIVFARTGATVGKAYCYHSSNAKYVYAGYLIRLRPNKKIVLPDYIFYYTKSKNYLDFISASQVAAAQPNVNAEKYSNLEIPVPPLEEQKRIVKILDEKFAQLETIKTNAQTNLQNAKDLFQSQLAKAFSNISWEKKRLQDCTSIIGDGLHGTPKYNDDGDYYFINGNNLEKTVIEIKPETKRVDESQFQKYKVELNDKTVFVSINGTLGKTAFYNDEPVILGKSACYANVKDCLNKYFLRYFYNSDEFLEYAYREATGATIKNLGLKAMRDLRIPLPPLPEQKRIVKELDTLSEKVRQLQEIYTKQIANCAELKQSLLQKAFEGEL